MLWAIETNLLFSGFASASGSPGYSAPEVIAFKMRSTEVNNLGMF